MISSGPNPILELRSVGHAYADTVVLTDVSFTLGSGEILCIIGPNGCGKTTLLHLVAGHQFPSRGHILLNGQDANLLPPNKRSLGFVFQDDTALFTFCTVRQNIEFPFTHGGRRLPGNRDWRTAVNTILAATGLNYYQDKPIHTLSGGWRRRVAIARSLVYEPTLVLLDEPMSALDNIKKQEFIPLLKGLQRHTNSAFLYVTHDDREVRQLADRVIVMNSGIVEQAGKVPEILKEPTPTTRALFHLDSKV